MSYSAVVFASVGAVADLAELDRRAFNLAFHGADLDWVWEPARYQRLCTLEDDAARIATYAVDAGDMVDVAQICDTKAAMSRQLLAHDGVTPRPGVVELLRAAQARNLPVSLCARRPASEVHGVIDAMAPALSARDFDWVGDSDMLEADRSLADVFILALCSMQVQPYTTLAIVDTPYAARAAREAGVQTIVLTGALGPGWQLPDGVRVVSQASAALLQGRAIAAE